MEEIKVTEEVLIDENNPLVQNGQQEFILEGEEENE